MPYCSICDKKISSEDEYVDMYRGICVDCYESFNECHICGHKYHDDDLFELFDPSEDRDIYICDYCWDTFISEWKEMIKRARNKRKGGD